MSFHRPTLFFAAVLLILFSFMLPSSTGLTSPWPQEDPMIIAYITGHEENGFTAGTISGFSRFSYQLNALGGVVRTITLDKPIAEEVDMIVIGSPKQPSLTDGEISRLWSFVQRGGSLLILNDPAPNRGLPASSALNQLLWEDYGIRWQEDKLIEDWFNAEALEPFTSYDDIYQPQRSTGLQATAIAESPITTLLIKYNLPVFYWQARSLLVQRPAINGAPFSLLKTRGFAYGETTFDDQRPVFNIGRDTTPGEIVLAAAVEDYHTGARIVVIGDSEIFKNQYGLEGGTYYSNPPAFAGNNIFMQAVARWLLHLPVEEVELHDQSLWIAIDGDASDWEIFAPHYVSDATTGPVISSIKITRSDRRIYMAIDTIDVPYPLERVIVRGLNSQGNAFSFVLEFNGNIQMTVTTTEGNRIFYGVQLVMGDIIEMSLPIQAFPTNFNYSVTDVCVVYGELICSEFSVSTIPIAAFEPRGRDLLLDFASARIITTNGLNIRETIGGQTIATIGYGEFVNVLGHDETGNWAHVWIDGMEGWQDASLLSYPYDETTYRERNISEVIAGTMVDEAIENGSSGESEPTSP